MAHCVTSPLMITNTVLPKTSKRESFKYYVTAQWRTKVFFVRKKIIFKWRNIFKFANSCDYFSRISFRWSFELTSSQINSFFKQTCGETIHVYYVSFVNPSTLYWRFFMLVSESEKGSVTYFSFYLHSAWQRRCQRMWVNDYDVTILTCYLTNKRMVIESPYV